ncbi:hypothetical protein VC273_22285 [Xanthomonas nasturtii]|uniref:hypothetical protein n=1 Tax=Xanthomonas TaxID=338 RepID=UPI000E1F2908|nr:MULTISPECIES: hypothetical protein [Xanthomonas]MEA9558514.1 hypothetical protein [Xanthomonas nasturtii]
MIQLSKQIGAHVATANSTSNVPVLRRLGAAASVDYKTKEFQDVPRDYDVVLGISRSDALEKKICMHF